MRSPSWLVASKIAGPQLAYNSTSQYDQYVDRQWQWARDSSYTDISQHAFLFDRASVIGFQYVRNGKPEWFSEFYNSATFYLSHIKTTGAGGGYHLRAQECQAPAVIATRCVLPEAQACEIGRHELECYPRQ